MKVTCPCARVRVVDLHICNSGTSENVAAPIRGALLSSGNLESNDSRVRLRPRP